MALAAVGAGFGILGSLVQGQNTSDVMGMEADTQTRNAKQALTASYMNAAKMEVNATRLRGNQSAEAAGSGITQESGSVSAIMASSAANAELDRQNVLYGGQLKALNDENQASIDTMQGNNAVQASYLNALGFGVKAAGTAYANSSGGSPISSNIDPDTTDLIGN